MPKRRRKTRQWRKEGREVEDEVMEVIRKRGEEEAMRGVENDQLFTIDKSKSTEQSSSNSSNIFDEDDLKMKRRKKEPRMEKVRKSSEKTFNIIIECCQFNANEPIILLIPVKSTVIIACNAPPKPKTYAQSKINCSNLILYFFSDIDIMIPMIEK